MIRKLLQTYGSTVKHLEVLGTWLPQLLCRITLGWVFIESGWGKLHNLDKVIAFFLELHIPAPEFQAPLVAGIELGGGVLVLVGLLTRLSSIPVAATMVVAIFAAKLGDLTSISDLFGFIEYLYVLQLMYLFLVGGGRLSVDSLFAPRIRAMSGL